MPDDGPTWKKRQQIPDAHVKDAADQFDAARQVLLSQSPDSGILLPLLNSSAIALELYLKSLSAIQDWRPATEMPGVHRVYARAEKTVHRLQDLLDTVPTEVRTDLERKYQAGSIPGLPVSFRDALAVFDDLFKDSRYAYEAAYDITKYPFQPLMSLVEFIAQFVATRPAREYIHW